MPRRFAAVLREIWSTCKRPARIRRLFNARDRNRLLRRFRGHAPWESGGERGVRTRVYRDYEDYTAHQASKLAELGDLTPYDERFKSALRERIDRVETSWPDRHVLCLGARTGAEVRAFHELGARATGIDLAPARGAFQVVQGDFHALPFGDDSADTVYTNSLDHALELDRVVGEIDRVLTHNGFVILELNRGTSEGVAFDRWAATSWEHVDDVLRVFETRGFTAGVRRDFSVPWPGTQVVLHRAGSESPE